VVRLPAGVKHPQMQWNRVDLRADSPLFSGLGEHPWMYFVHSFAPELTADAIATCDYGGEVVAAAQRENVMATQFHPEKSGATGLRLLGNFVALAAAAPAA
jgi:glutamine amidotransferase